MDRCNKKFFLAIGIPTIILIGVAFLLLNYYSKQLKVQTPIKEDTAPVVEEKTLTKVDCGEFKEFGPIEYYKGEPAPVQYEDFAGAVEFKSAIEESIKEGANFAGKYRVTEWGCGTACQNIAVINLKTGHIVAFGLLSSLGSNYSLDKTFLTLNPLERIKQIQVPQDLESRLLGKQMFSDLESETYQIDSKNDTLLFQCRATAQPPENQICVQVLAQATNEATGETRTFSTPCSVPRNNWKKKAPNTIVE